MRCAIRWAENTSREKEPDLVRRKKKDPSPDLIRNALGTIGLKLDFIGNIPSFGNNSKLI